MPPTTTPTTDPTTTAPPALPTVARLTVATTWTQPGPKKDIPWPKRGRARLEVAGIGVLGRSGADRSVPIASVTKVMTAYTVLQDHPLAPDQDGR